ncbi:LD-carboxypeptidase [Amphiplicatus metriothermophilus]|nr:LD-carboxypeptidase [Amphiplicatus metriothermophilus]MBB5519306.1 muramoyltetrapeptide carboxypeptidase [Amphiplicatus metriothermophilus]
MKIAVVAPASRVAPETAEKTRALAARLYGAAAPEIHFHPQCFLSDGHFAGSDAARSAAFLEAANDPAFDAVWFGRGGYGSCRLDAALYGALNGSARKKVYLGYSDLGVVLARLYREGIGRPVHGPMPSDVNRPGGEAALARALKFLVENDAETLEPAARDGKKVLAFNIAVLSSILGTAHEPDFCGHVLMLEEVSEYMYRIDRALFHVTSSAHVRRAAGIMLGRCSDIPENDVDFGRTEEEICRHWCARAGIAYLGRADIGHDADNKVVPFGGAGAHVA